MTPAGFVLFALEHTRALGEAVAGALGVGLAAHEERAFEDGEHKLRPLESVRGREIYVIQSLYTDARARASTTGWCACCTSSLVSRITARPR